MSTQKKIFRFKLSDDCNTALADFTQKHHFNAGDRKRFKQDWETWCSQNKDIIDIESRRLENLGYDGDCLAKMFTSVRYYHIKKLAKKKQEEEVRETVISDEEPEKKKRSYIALDKEFLKKIDEHITTHIKFDNFKPSVGYELFINTYDTIINEQKEKVCNDDFKEEDFNLKVKKTYKNRYFNLVK